MVFFGRFFWVPNFFFQRGASPRIGHPGRATVYLARGGGHPPGPEGVTPPPACYSNRAPPPPIDGWRPNTGPPRRSAAPSSTTSGSSSKWPPRRRCSTPRTWSAWRSNSDEGSTSAFSSSAFFLRFSILEKNCGFFLFFASRFLLVHAAHPSPAGVTTGAKCGSHTPA